MKRFVVLFFALAVAGFAAAQSAPALVNYQGRLTDASGVALTGVRDLSFKVFASPCATAPCGDTPVWGPQALAGVQLNDDGQFNVILGPTDVDGDSILTAFGEANRYLEVTVGAAQPVLPRQQVLSSPYALAASGRTGDLKMSIIGSDHGGWLLCDGRAVSRSTYSQLFALVGTSFGAGDGTTTFNLPDLRGRVAGNIGQGSGLTNRGLGQAVGEETHLQTSNELAPHHHWIGYRNIGAGSSGTIQNIYLSDIDPWNGVSFSSASTGGGQPFNVMQPTTFVGNTFIHR